MSNILKFGLIHDYYPRERIFSIKQRNQISFYYYPKNFQKFFERAMGHKHVFVEFVHDKKTKIIKGYPSYHLISLNKLFFMSNTKRVELFDDKEDDVKLIDLINYDGYKMFMDLELTMPKFGETNPFKPEILQIGCVIIDENDEIVNYYTNYVKTDKPLSDRTYRFLSLGKEATRDAIPYDQFYEEYKELLDIYDPIVYVWGGNDVSSLEDSYKQHKKKPLKANYQDLLKIHHKFFNLKTDISLFKALKIYRGIDVQQVHHALTDAQATKEVYDGFKKHINGIEYFDVKAYQENMLNKENSESDN